MRRVLLTMWVLGTPVTWAQDSEDESPVEDSSSNPSSESESSPVDSAEEISADEGAPETVPAEDTSDAGEQATIEPSLGPDQSSSQEIVESLNSTDPAIMEQIGEVESLDDATPPPVIKEPQGPEDLVINYEEGDPEAADLSKAMLLDYCLKSKTVVVGRVLTSRVEVGVLDELVELRVEEILRGEPPPVITARVPIPEPDGGFIDGNVEQSARVIPGYRLLVFLDPSGTVVNGDAVFFTESGFAFRNKRADNFLRPRSDRDWIENVDPSVDYYVYTIQAVKDAIEANPMDYKKLKDAETGKKKRKWFCPFRRDK